MEQKKGFTLIELLIVVGILAVLATITVLVLNPAQLFAQARDSQRLSDLGSVKGAIALYLTTIDTPSLEAGSPAFSCTTNWGTSVADVSGNGASSTFTRATAARLHMGVRTTNGDGWVAVNMDSMTGGSPLPVLPVDPVNSIHSGGNQLNYQYACDNVARTFELVANMESQRYGSGGGGDDVESTDGGNQNDYYEVGTDPKLDL